MTVDGALFNVLETGDIMRSLKAALAIGLIAVAEPATASKVKVGQPAPEAVLNLVNGQKVSLSALRGQVVLINFWATWCVPCRKELPTLDAYYRVQRKFGLRVFAATTEDSVPIASMTKLFSLLSIDAVRRIRGPYESTGAVPTNIIIDRAGTVRYYKAGAFDLDGLNDALVPLLQEPAPPAMTSGTH